MNRIVMREAKNDTGSWDSLFARRGAQSSR